MSFGSLLLRLLLSLCLVLDGTAAAAIAHLPMGHDAAAASMPAPPTASTAAVMADMPCHGHDAASSTTPTSATSLTAPDPAGSSPDCCESGACRCACMHVAQVVVPSLAWAAATPGHARSVRPLLPGHTAPPLPHPIRPPIG